MKKASHCGTKTRHTLSRELPLPIYIGLDIHQQTRSKRPITQFHCMGISISYDRVMDLEKKIALSVYKRFEEEGVKYPA